MSKEKKDQPNQGKDEQNVVEVGSLFAVVQGDKLAGVEVQFNNSLQGAETAANVLNHLNHGLHDAGWMFRNIARVVNSDAQPDYTPEESSGTDDEVTAGK